MAWLALFAPPQSHAQQAEVVDEIVTVVGDQIVLRSDVDGLVLSVLQQQQQQQTEYSDALWRDALNQLVDQKVLAVHARRDTTIQVTDEQVEQALDDRINQLTRQVGSTTQIEQIYGKSLVQIKADLRSEFRERLLAERFQGRKLQQIKITPTEVNQWFSQFPTDSLPTLPDIVRLSHVVRYPTISPEAEQDALDIISTIRDSVMTGTSTLEDMARRFSEDQGSAPQGGRYQEMSLGDLVPEFAAVASRQPIDSLSQPFKSQFGFHILRVNDRRGDIVDFSHILIAIDQSKADPTEAIEYLAAVRDSILTSDIPFEIMARRNSEEGISMELGGRVVDPRTGERDLFLEALGPTWRDTIDTLQVDEISYPGAVETLDGKQAYHIVKLTKRVPSHRVDIETDYVRIEQLALRDKQSRVMRQWLDGLREEVFIEMRGKAASLSDNATSVASGRN